MATFLRFRSTLVNPGISGTGLVTTYWDSAGGTGAALATEAAARVRAFFNSLASSFAGGSVWTPNLTVDEIEETNGVLVNQYSATAPAAVAFTGTGTSLPPQTQYLLRFNTATFTGGRRISGRMFLGPCLLGGMTTGGIPTTTQVTALNNAAALLGTTIVTPMSQRVWHRPKNGTGGLTAVVTSRQASTAYSVLRSRRP